DMTLVLGELLEHGQLIAFLETAQADAGGAGFGRHDDHRRVRPVCGGDGGDAVADARTVLTDHDTVAAADASIAVGHVSGALLVHDRDQSNACGSENIHGVHEGRTHDAEHFRNAVGDECFY